MSGDEFMWVNVYGPDHPHEITPEVRAEMDSVWAWAEQKHGITFEPGEDVLWQDRERYPGTPYSDKSVGIVAIRKAAS